MESYVYHIIAGFVAYFLLDKSRWVYAVSAVALAKEGCDAFLAGTVDFLDVAATLSGGVLAYSVYNFWGYFKIQYLGRSER
jgi:hypothetical protein